MPFNGAGSYSPPAADFPAVAGTLIESAKFNNIVNDVATALSSCITKNGETTITANLPMAGFRHTGVGNASARNDYAAYGQVQDGASVWGGTAGGTANALTLALTPAITAYAAGQAFRFKAAATNTGAVTVAINGLSTKAIQESGAALAGGEILQDGIYEIVYDGTQFQLSSLSIPAWSTGDVKITYKTSADAGWIMANDGSIGSAGSGATTRANADTEALYTLLYNNVTDTHAPVAGGRGANAAADFAANKALTLPKNLGRAIAISGSGSGLTARALGEALGHENLQQHQHGVGTLALDSQGAHTHTENADTSPDGSGANTVITGSNTESIVHNNSTSNTTSSNGAHVHTISGSTANTGTGTGENMQPSGFKNAMIKL